jgi:hypothetical protein
MGNPIFPSPTKLIFEKEKMFLMTRFIELIFEA